jgi:Leucine-rich repeat (LRR) protein/predicted Ser/Thr protein kinase
LLRGQLSDADLEGLAQHVQRCTACTARAEALLAGTREGDARKHLSVCLGRSPGTEDTLAYSEPTSSQGDAAPPPDDPLALVRSLLAPPQGPDEVGRLAGYRVLKLLGQGGMGLVLLAEDIELRRRVALKVMQPEQARNTAARERFLREARAMAAIKHDHVATIYQVGQDRGLTFLAMEYLKGESLDGWLKRGKKPTLGQALRLARETAAGLAAAHARGLVHRDIKPGNLWLEAPGGRVKVLDFGLARPAAEDTQLTQSGMVVGTPAFMAPEQARGQTIDHRCDLFSLGCVLYRLLAGRLPFQGPTALAVLTSIALDAPKDIRDLSPEVPPAVSDLVTRLLAKSPADRPVSAQAVVEAIRETERGLSVARQQATIATPATSAEASAGQDVTAALTPPKPAGRRKRLVLAAAVVSAVIALAAAIGIVRVATDKGEFVIETDDPAVAVAVEKAGITLQDKKTGRQYEVKVGNQPLPSGEYELEVADRDAGLEFKTRSFTIKRGEKVACRVSFREKQPEAKAPPAAGKLDEPWFKAVAKMDPQEQVKAVAAKLKELNPGFDGDVKPVIANGVVTQLEFVTDEVSDIRPVRALPRLAVLLCHGRQGGKQGKLASLSALEGMKLVNLAVYGNSLWDLAPLRGMPLQSLNFSNSQVADLTPLRGMRLRSLAMGMTRVTDLNPLRGMPLVALGVAGLRFADLKVLEGMPLQALYCSFVPAADASMLRSMKTLQSINGGPAAEFWAKWDKDRAALEDWAKSVRALKADEQVKAVAAKLKELNPGFDGAVHPTITKGTVTGLEFRTDAIRDLFPVRALPALQSLVCSFPRPDKGILTDLAPLRGLALTQLDVSNNRIRDLTPLRDLPLRNLNCSWNPVSDLSALSQLQLRLLACNFTPVENLAPLKNIPLITLQFANSAVKDLSPLASMKTLQFLRCNTPGVVNLEPLRGLFLRRIWCNFKPERDTDFLRSIKTLQMINGTPAAEFWKELEMKKR